jgi:hypothetical protein
MSSTDEISTQIAKLELERESVMLKERGDVLATVKEDVKLYDFKRLTSSFFLLFARL